MSSSSLKNRGCRAVLLVSLSIGVCWLLAGVAKAQSPNVISNGDFSANASGFTGFPGYIGGGNPDSITNWTLAGNGANYGLNGFDTNTTVFYDNVFAIRPGQSWTSTSGNTVKDFLFTQSVGVVSQSFNGNAGDLYITSFDASTRNDGEAGAWNVTTGSGANFNTTALTGTQWQGFSFAFTAQASDGITFTGMGSAQNFTNVVVKDISGATWNGGATGVLGDATGNFTAATNITQAAAYDAGNLYFADTDGVGNVPVTNITTQPGGVSATQLWFLNNNLNYTIASSDATGITGSTSIVKSGSGMLTLSGTHTYTGSTIVSAGTLRVTGASNVIVNSSAITVQSGAILTGDGAQTLNGTLLLAGGTLASGTLDPSWGSWILRNSTHVTVNSTISATGVVPANSNFNVNGGITLNVTGTFWDGANGPSQVNAIGAGTINLADTNNSYSGDTIFSSGVVNVASLADYGNNSSLGNRAASQDSGGDEGLLFRGGTLQYTGSTPQSTNRAIRLSTTGGGGTIDASGSNVNATLTFTAATSPNWWENGGVRALALTGTNTGANTMATEIDDTGGTTIYLFKNGPGTWYLTSTNSNYNGDTVFQGGILNVASLADYGDNNSLGRSSLGDRSAGQDAGGDVGLLFRGGTLQYTGSTPQSTNRAIRLSTTGGGGTIDASGTVPTATLSFTATTSPNLFENPGARTLRLTGSNTGANTFAMELDEAGGATSVYKSGAGTWYLTNTNSSYSGDTTIQGGVLNVASLSDYGANSSIGNRSASQDTANGAQDIGLLFRGGTLQYTGSTPQSTNRAIRINADFGNGLGGGATIDASGSTPAATLSFTATSSPNLFEVAGTRTLTLTGINTGSNLFAMALSDAGAPTSLVKSGPGTWVLSGNSSYGGATLLQAGTLRIQNSNALGAGGFNSQTWTLETSGATLEIDGSLTIGEHIHISGTGNGGIGAIHVLSGNSSLNQPISFDADTTIGVDGGASLTMNSDFYDNSAPTLLTKIGGGTLTITAACEYQGGTNVVGGTLSITNLNGLGGGTATVGSGATLALEEVSGTLANNLTLDGGSLLYAHNDGQTDTFSGTVTLVAGALPAKIRGFSNGGSWIFNNPIGGTGDLTFEAGGATSMHTQTWTLQGGASTYNGNTLISSDGSANAVVQLNGGSLPATTVLTLADSSTIGGNDAVLDLNGNNQTLAGLNNSHGSGGLGSFVMNSSSSLATLTVDSGAFGGVIGQNTTGGTTGQTAGTDNIALVKTTAGTLILSNASTYSGGTTVNNGVLQTNVSGALGSGALAINAAATVNTSVNLGGSETLGGLSTNIDPAGTGTLNMASGNTLTIGPSGPTSIQGTLRVTGGGTLSINSGSVTLASGSSLSIQGGTVRINAGAGTSGGIGSGVTATVATGAALELANSVPVPLPVADRVTVTNNGTLAIGDATTPVAAVQQVGGIDGTGSVVVNNMASLTADHINQTSLVIGAGATFTLAPSNADGTPMASGGSSLALAGSLTPASSFIATNTSLLGAGAASGAPAVSLGGGALGASISAVPEPTSFLLIAIGALAIGIAARRRP